jgi:hypothetical protein
MAVVEAPQAHSVKQQQSVAAVVDNLRSTALWVALAAGVVLRQQQLLTMVGLVHQVRVTLAVLVKAIAVKIHTHAAAAAAAQAKAGFSRMELLELTIHKEKAGMA